MNPNTLIRIISYGSLIVIVALLWFMVNIATNLHIGG